MGMELAKAQGLDYFEASAQTQQGNLEPFHHIAESFHRRYAETVDSAAREM